MNDRPDTITEAESGSLTGEDTYYEVIRTETALSKFPIHNLSKKGRVEIDILRRGSDGVAEAKWKVSPNPEFGEPGQIAYKLDTLIINRRLEESGKPLPKYIKLGSLRELCQELDITASGKNVQNLKNAFLQNASAFITAKITYTATDGAKHSIEAGFTRYNVVFTGEQLPDGRPAEAVYLIPNEIYRDVINRAQVRPLNYDYLKALTPTAQRFYEIISYRLFAAFQKKNPHAAITYSEYCARAAQIRYFDWEHMRKQMYKIHRPHLASKYLSKVEFQAQLDDTGQPDWLMLYTGGPKAKSEYARFTKRQGAVDLSPASAQKAAKAARKSGAKRLRAPAPPAARHAGGAAAVVAPAAPPVPTAEPGPDWLAALTAKGITRRGAQSLLAGLAPGQAAQLPWQLAYGEHLIATAVPPVHNPAGFLVTLIRDNVAVPDNFANLFLKPAGHRDEARAAVTRQADLTQAYEVYKEQAVARHLTALTPAAKQTLYEQERALFVGKFPLARNWPEEVLQETVRATIWQRLEMKLPLLAYEAFVAQHEAASPPLP